jgi:hypothetical protein
MGRHGLQGNGEADVGEPEVVDDEQPRDAAQADKGEGDDRLPPP